MLSSKDSFVEVPEPLYKFRGEKEVHPDNEAIINMHKRDGILKNREVKRLEKQLKKLTRNLNREGYPKLIKERARLKRDFVALANHLMKHTRFYSRCYAFHIARIIFKAMASILKEAGKIKARLNPLRGDIRLRNDIKQKLQTHKAQVQQQKKDDEMQKDLMDEASKIANTISRELGRMEFKHVEKRGKQKARTHYVKWDFVIVTPDQIQLKMLTGKQGLFGGYVPLLPDGVRPSEILNERVMDDLTSVLEREVWSPHIRDAVPTVNGVWLVVERMGLVEGIQREVSYSQLMARYETANHQLLPVPLGLMRGRRINWLELDSAQGLHTIFTGISGSGKSNLMRACISALVEKQSPKDVSMVFIDLKKSGDFADFEDIPHTIRYEDKGILETANDVLGVLRHVRDEMHMRHSKVAKMKNIGAYNRWCNPEDKLPHLVIVFDEYANVRRTKDDDIANEIDDICIEIGQMGRSAGIHLWVGIQQPTATNMPQPLRYNMSTYVIGRQSTTGASQSVLGNFSATKLPDIPGRFLIKSYKEHEVQAPKITDEEVQRAVETAKTEWGHIEPYELVYKLDMTTPLTKEDVILEAVFNSFDGELKARKLWEHLDKRYSLNEVTEVVNSIIEMETVKWNDTEYKLERQPGNYYKLQQVQYEMVVT